MRLATLTALLIIAPLAFAHAPDQEAAEFRIATAITPPFVMQDAQGAMSGIDVALWEQIAATLGVRTTWEVMDVAGALEAVRSGRADAAMAALTISQEREATLDFSHAYDHSGLGIAVREGPGGLVSVLSLARGVFTLAFWQTIAALAGVLLASGVLMWLFERRANAGQFSPGPRGLGDGFWWSAVTMTTVGYGDKAPVTIGGRVVALVWMFTSIIIIAAFTGGIASAVTVGALDGKIAGPADLPGARVAALAGATAVEHLRDMGVSPRQAQSVEAALELLEAGEVDAVVHDAPVLRWLSRESADLRVLEATFAPQSYGIALAEDDPRREEINQALLAEINSDAWRRTKERYLGQ